MKVVGKHSHHVDVGLEALGIDVLHVVVLSRNDDTNTKIAAQGFSHLFDELNLVGTVTRSTAAALVARPLPVDIDALEAPLGAELFE